MIEEVGSRVSAANEDRNTVTAEISRAVVRIMKQQLGRGPTRCRTHLNSDHAVVFCRETLTEAEKTLVAAGKREHVKDARQHLEEVIRAELAEAVESLTGRKVASVLFDLDPDADLLVQLFVFDGFLTSAAAGTT